MQGDIDLRAAINAISDVIQNRPRPIRELDQIYMKTADMVLQSELVADWASDQRVAFIGDGDAISVCVAYLRARGIIDYGPSKITVFDFDERIVSAINRFADRERLETLEGRLYNCLDSFPGGNRFDCFYTNPPWGASNNGESVNVFVQRGIEATAGQGTGMIVIADDDHLEWPRRVLLNVHRYAIARGYYVSRMMPRVHSYHLDDAPDLRSCNLIVSAQPDNIIPDASMPIYDASRLANFYGQNQSPRVRFVREVKSLNYGMANEGDYELELLEGA